MFARNASLTSPSRSCSSALVIIRSARRMESSTSGGNFSLGVRFAKGGSPADARPEGPADLASPPPPWPALPLAGGGAPGPPELPESPPCGVAACRPGQRPGTSARARKSDAGAAPRPTCLVAVALPASPSPECGDEEPCAVPERARRGGRLDGSSSPLSPVWAAPPWLTFAGLGVPRLPGSSREAPPSEPRVAPRRSNFAASAFSSAAMAWAELATSPHSAPPDETGRGTLPLTAVSPLAGVACPRRCSRGHESAEGAACPRNDGPPTGGQAVGMPPA